MIRVSCPDCGLTYALSGDRLDRSGAALRCTRCNAEIAPESRTEVPRPAQIRPPPRLAAVPRARGAAAARASVKAEHEAIEFDWADLDAGSGPRPKAKLNPRPRAAPPPSRNWVVELGDDVQETMQLAELCELYARGSVGPTTRIRAAGSRHWSRAPDLPEVAAALAERGVALLPRIELTDDDEDACDAPTSALDAARLWAASSVGTEDETAVIDSRRLVTEAFRTTGAADPSSESKIATMPPPPEHPVARRERAAVRLDDEDDVTLLYQRDEEEPVTAELSPETQSADPVELSSPTVTLRVQAPDPAPPPPAVAKRSPLAHAALLVLAFLLGAVAFTAAAAASVTAYDLITRDDAPTSPQH